MRRAAFLPVALLLAACGAERSGELPAEIRAAPAAPTVAMSPYADAAAALEGIAWSPALERQVAGLLVGKVLNRAALEQILTDARPALDALADAAHRNGWTLPPPDAPRVSRDDWEAAVWLAYGEARTLADDGEVGDAAARAALAGALAARLASADGAGLGDLVIAFGLSEAASLQAQRMAAALPGEAARFAPPPPLPQAAWSDAMRAEAIAATDRIAAMAADPVGGLGLSADAIPPDLADAAPADLFDTAAVQDEAVGLFLTLADRTLADCDAPPPLPRPAAPDPGAPNLAGHVFLRDLRAALVQIDDRRCLTEAARRAAALAVRLHAAEGGLPAALPDDRSLADPFTGAPFAYDAAGGTIRSAGRDRTLAYGPGRGPFDDDEPTWFLDLRPLL